MADELAARIADAADDVRRRATRELHDGPQQQFVAAAIRLQLAQRVWETDASRSRALMGDALGLLQDGLEGLREFVAELHPPILTSHGLGAAVTSLAERLDRGIAVEDRLGDGRPAASLETMLYLVVAGALRTATGAGRVELSCDDALIVVDIAVPGAAFDQAARDRLQAAGATSGARGTGLRITAPLRR